MFALFFLGGGEILLLAGLVFFLPISLMLMAFWIWMLVDAAKNPGLNQNERIVWIIVVALLHWLGAAIYFFFGRPKRRLVPAT